MYKRTFQIPCPAKGSVPEAQRLPKSQGFKSEKTPVGTRDKNFKCQRGEEAKVTNV